MKNLVLKHFSIVLTLFTAVLLTVAGTAVAMQTVDEVEEIIVKAPVQVQKHVTRNTTGATGNTEIIELTRPVSITDLDLSDQADVEILETRIAAMAEDSCEKLSAMFPLDRSDPAEFRRCTRLAIESALNQKERAIADAN